MQIKRPNEYFVEIVTSLFVVLFVYAASSKLMDYNHFRLELGKSPVLAGISGSLAWLVPFLEIGIALMLVIRKLQLFGLYLSFTLMTMFTSYLITVLHFSEFVPCTCGGFIEKMNWNQHILFNLVFIVLSLVAVLIYPGDSDQQLTSTHLEY